MRVITHQPADKKKGMTLEELSRFVAEAYSLETPGDTPVKVLSGFRSQITEIKTTTN